MANSTGEDPSDDFLEQILGFPNYGGGGGGAADTNLAGNDSSNLTGSPASMMLQLGLADGSDHLGSVGIGAFHHGALDAGCGFPLGSSSEQGSFGRGGFMRMDDALRRGNRFGDDRVESRAVSSVRPIFRESPMSARLPSPSNPPAMRPRTRARRGQATDPHSIAERLRRERITERVRALQELVPGVNKTDRAVMVDEIVDYVKFLRLQVKVLSMSRMGGAGAVAPLVTDIPISSVEEESGEGGPTWDKLSNEGTEQQVAKLMEEDVGAAMQFLQSKALCIMPISLASTIYNMQPPDVKPQTDPV